MERSIKCFLDERDEISLVINEFNFVKREVRSILSTHRYLDESWTKVGIIVRYTVGENFAPVRTIVVFSVVLVRVRYEWKSISTNERTQRALLLSLHLPTLKQFFQCLIPSHLISCGGIKRQSDLNPRGTICSAFVERSTLNRS